MTQELILRPLLGLSVVKYGDTDDVTSGGLVILPTVVVPQQDKIKITLEISTTTTHANVSTQVERGRQINYWEVNDRELRGCFYFVAKNNGIFRLEIRKCLWIQQPV